MSVEHYERLRQFLDKISVTGMPKTESGVELRVLEKLFSSKEAKAAVYLKPVPEPAAAIAERMGKDPQKVSQLLEQMAEHRLIRAVPRENAVDYQAMPFVPGILELSARTADAPYARDYLSYLDEGFANGFVKAGRIPVARTIPIDKSIASGQKVVAYDQISEIIEKAPRPRAVTECWCRKIKEIAGEHCNKSVTMEVCISFGLFAQNMIDSKTGREIDDAEIRNIIAEANEAGLVPTVALNTSSFEDILNLCNCCNCCCGVLKSMIRHYDHDFQGGQAPSSYIASIDEDKCGGCELCIDRCQTSALFMENEISTLKQGRCIGCGLCTTACPEEAIALIQRRQEDIPKVPRSALELFEQIFITKNAKDAGD